MIPVTDSFTFEYEGTDLVYGRGCIDELGESLAERGLERALVVCGTNVGANEDVMGPLRRGLGDRLVAVFDETTPAKSAETAFDGIEVMEEHDADVLVAVGGGSSIDIARQMSVFRTDGRTLDDLRDEIEREGDIRQGVGGDSVTPTVAVPTTFAGADISSGGSLVVSSADEPPLGEVYRVRVGDERATPVEVRYDPDLFETTPMGALVGSAMNGFNKGIETIYSRTSTPISDGTAVHGLTLLREALPRLGDDADAMERSIIGIVLVQFERQSGPIHAFGHGFSRRYPVQQGVVHAIVAPHVLRHIFGEVDARRELLARGLDIDAESLSDEEVAEAVVDAVVAVRDSLDLPTRLGELDSVDRDDVPAIAEFIRDDGPMRRAPEGYDPTVEELEAVIEEAW